METINSKTFIFSNFKDMENKIAIYCKDEKTTIDFMKCLHYAGINWVSGKNTNKDIAFNSSLCYVYGCDYWNGTTNYGLQTISLERCNACAYEVLYWEVV